MTTVHINDILALLPHRYPFLLVDRILSIEPGKRIIGLKNISVNEPYFQGHFPGLPIMPGVLIIEAMAQVGGVLAFQSAHGRKGEIIFVVSIDKAKFRSPVYPGDRMIIEVEVLQERHPFWRLKAVASVEGKRVAQTELKAMIGRSKDMTLPLRGAME